MNLEDEKDNIKRSVSSKLKNLEVAPPASVWEKISKDLTPISCPPAPSRSKTKRISAKKISIWATSIAAVIAIIILIRIDQPNNVRQSVISLNEDKKTQISEIESDNKKEKKSLEDSANSNIIQKTNNLLATTYKNRKKDNTTLSDRKHSTGKKEIGIISDTTDISENKGLYTDNNTTAVLSDNNNDVKKDPLFEQELAEKINQFIEDGQNTNNLLADNTIDLTKNRKEGNAFSNGLSIGMKGGSGLSKATENEKQLRLAIINTEEYNPTGIVNALKKRQMKLEHNQPILFGFNINKKLSRKLSVETGINYTYLHSRIVSTDELLNPSKDNLNFHYLGIPISLNYDLIRWKNLKLYLSAGGMIQKDIYGKLRTNQNLENPKKFNSLRISQTHPQFSANASLGISYPIYNKLSVYTTLGGSYYFDAGNEYATIYSDKKWLFNFNLGLKVGF